MRHNLKNLLLALLLVCVVLVVRADNCAICGKEITGRVFLMTDKVTGEKVEVCSDCIQLPTCFICGLPVKDGLQLPDGRWLCARDAKTAVLNIDDVQRIFGDVQDDLDNLFSRFTIFPTNLDVSVIDRVDVNSMFELIGNEFESPNVLGITQPVVTDGVKRYKIALLTGQPENQLEEVCAHELSHAWVGENVSPERHARLARDAEEGFCEMMGYLLVDSKGDEGEKKRVMANAYTRGQVKLFVQAEQEYGMDEVLDWMQYGAESKLEPGHVDEIRDVKLPVNSPGSRAYAVEPFRASAPSAPATIELQGILWGAMPSAIINGRSFFAGDEFPVRVGNAKVTIRCLAIMKNAVKIQNLESGETEELDLHGH